MFLVVKPESWEEMRHLVALAPGNWAYRGQSKESWGLSSTLERAVFVDDGKDRRELIQGKEKLILWEFKRQAHPPRMVSFNSASWWSNASS